MKLPHFTQHGTRTKGDSLDVFVEESAVLSQLFANWDATDPDRTTGDETVEAKWDHGTVGKLLLEHAAVRLAASEDIADVLRGCGRRSDATRMNENNIDLRRVLDQMYENSHGIQPISLAVTPGFVDAANDLQEMLRQELSGGRQELARQELVVLLGEERSRLRSAKFVRKHAPAHPGRSRHWYDRIPVLLRVHAAEDRLRGFPWGESSLGDRKLAERYDREV